MGIGATRVMPQLKSAIPVKSALAHTTLGTPAARLRAARRPAGCRLARRTSSGSWAQQHRSFESPSAPSLENGVPRIWWTTLASGFLRRSDAEVQTPDPRESPLGLRIH